MLPTTSRRSPPTAVQAIDQYRELYGTQLVLGIRYIHVTPSGRGPGAGGKPRGFESTAGPGQSTLCSASGPCPLSYRGGRFYKRTFIATQTRWKPTTATEQELDDAHDTNLSW